MILKFSKRKYTASRIRSFLKKHHITEYKKLKSTKLYYVYSIDDKHLGGDLTSFLNDIGRRLSGITMAISGTRTNLKPSVRKILEQDGDITVKDIKVCRSPLKRGINYIINFINAVEERTPAHDVLFHLYMIITLDNGKQYIIEKNEDINIKPFEAEELTECRDIITPTGLTMRTMLDRTLNAVGSERFYHYDAFSNNCQQFVKDVITSNGIQLDNDKIAFIMQDVSDVLPDWAQEVTRFATDLQNRINTVIEGEGVKKSRKRRRRIGRRR